MSIHWSFSQTSFNIIPIYFHVYVELWETMKYFQFTQDKWQVFSMKGKWLLFKAYMFKLWREGSNHNVTMPNRLFLVPQHPNLWNVCTAKNTNLHLLSDHFKWPKIAWNNIPYIVEIKLLMSFPIPSGIYNLLPHAVLLDCTQAG